MTSATGFTIKRLIPGDEQNPQLLQDLNRVLAELSQTVRANPVSSERLGKLLRLGSLPSSSPSKTSRAESSAPAPS
jgi:hypothetical protein